MENKPLVEMCIDWAVGLTFIECYHSTSPLSASTSVAW